ncbi:MAG: UDP-N-acetylmuramoyl-tripeptide--D-alanyl-D-alanine ligase [Alphaproteobacteria bacterium]|nr:UDP-N-acetylmuramoyl-tripeptide--D-alanyl-D-alanine ligase [Alphaproteobacteria bacterium]
MTATNLWPAAEAAEAVKGRLEGDPDWCAQGVSIDSRTLAPGDLFVALAGPNFDGHDYVGQAFDKGAAAALVSGRPKDVAADAPLVQVGHVETALGDLAVAARRRCDAVRICITGSVGKTGTKDATARSLAAQAPTHATEGNLNNQLGTPLTLARMPAASRYAVLELGMNHAGELTGLSKLSRPDIAVITAIGAVHLEFFDSVADIALAKAEIFAGMDKKGTAVLNRDDAQFATLYDAADRAGLGRITTFGSHPHADVSVVEAESDASGSAVTVRLGQFGDRKIAYRIGAPGRHWIMNTACVLAAVDAAGADPVLAAKSFADLAVAKGRGRISTLDLGGQGDIRLIDDSYNANPVSMRAAFATLGLTQPEASGRRIAVLGDMLELGSRAQALHAGLACGLRDANVDLFFCAGEHMAALYEALPTSMRGAAAPNSAALSAYVADALRPGDVVLIKGSLGMGMNEVIEALRAAATGSARGSATGLTGKGR